MTDAVAVPVPETSARRRSLIAGCSAHAIHDGLTDVIYVLLPIWQAQFGLTYAQIGLLRGAYSGMMGSLMGCHHTLDVQTSS